MQRFLLVDSLNVKLNRTGVENPWFFFGVSYPGALSAWFRLKFPLSTCGSLASSTVVLAVYNYTKFDHQIFLSAGPECKTALQDVTNLVDQVTWRELLMIPILVSTATTSSLNK